MQMNDIGDYFGRSFERFNFKVFQGSPFDKITVILIIKGSFGQKRLFFEND